MMEQVNELIGSEVEVLESGGLSVLHAACLAGRAEVVNAILSLPAPKACNPDTLARTPALCLNPVPFGVDDLGLDGLSACTVTGLELAAAANHASVCVALLERKALVGRALHVAVVCGSLKACSAILGAFEAESCMQTRLVNSVIDGFSPLALAVLGSHKEIVRCLLDAAADPLQDPLAVSGRLHRFRRHRRRCLRRFRRLRFGRPDVPPIPEFCKSGKALRLKLRKSSLSGPRSPGSIIGSSVWSRYADSTISNTAPKSNINHKTGLPPSWPPESTARVDRQS